MNPKSHPQNRKRIEAHTNRQTPLKDIHIKPNEFFRKQLVIHLPQFKTAASILPFSYFKS